VSGFEPGQVQALKISLSGEGRGAVSEALGSGRGGSGGPPTNDVTVLATCRPWGRIEFEAKGRPGTQKPGSYPWFEVPGHAARELPLVFGHWSTLGLFMGLGVYGIDTGAVWGGRLTALELGPELRLHQVTGRVQEIQTAQT